MEIFKIVVLSLSGILLFYSGIMRLINPLKSYCLKIYLDNPDIKLEGEVDIFNEMRGAGAVTVFGGIVILLGTILPQFRLTSFVVAVLIFLGFAMGRLLSLGLDGKPNKDLVQGGIFEIVFSVLNIFCLVHILI